MRALSVQGAVAWCAGSSVTLTLVLIGVVVLRPQAATDFLTLAGCEAVVLLVFTALLIGRSDSQVALSEELGLRPTHAALPVLGVALGLSSNLSAASLRQLVEQYWPTPEVERIAQAQLLSGPVVGLLAGVCIVGPLVEEIFYRGAIYRGLVRRVSPGIAAITSGVMFVLAHWQVPRSVLPLMVVGALLSVVRWRGGSLLPPLGLHVGFNTVTAMVVLTGASEVDAPLDLSPLAIGASWVVTAGLLAAFLRVARDAEEAAWARGRDLA